MTANRTATAPVAATTNPELVDEFVTLMVESHVAGTIAERHDAERRARLFARRFRLDEFALEPLVIARVFEGMTDAELERATVDPSRRIAARAEQRRRANG